MNKHIVLISTLFINAIFICRVFATETSDLFCVYDTLLPEETEITNDQDFYNIQNIDISDLTLPIPYIQHEIITQAPTHLNTMNSDINLPPPTPNLKKDTSKQEQNSDKQKGDTTKYYNTDSDSSYVEDLNYSDTSKKFKHPKKRRSSRNKNAPLSSSKKNFCNRVPYSEMQNVDKPSTLRIMFFNSKDALYAHLEKHTNVQHFTKCMLRILYNIQNNLGDKFETYLHYVANLKSLQKQLNQEQQQIYEKILHNLNEYLKNHFQDLYKNGFKSFEEINLLIRVFPSQTIKFFTEKNLSNLKACYLRALKNYIKSNFESSNETQKILKTIFEMLITKGLKNNGSFAKGEVLTDIFEFYNDEALTFLDQKIPYLGFHNLCYSARFIKDYYKDQLPKSASALLSKIFDLLKIVVMKGYIIPEDLKNLIYVYGDKAAFEVIEEQCLKKNRTVVYRKIYDYLHNRTQHGSRGSKKYLTTLQQIIKKRQQCNESKPTTFST